MEPNALVSQTDLFGQLSTDSALMEMFKAVSTITKTKILTVTNDEMEIEYSTMLVQTRNILRVVEERRKSFVDPLNRLVKSVNEYLKANFTTPIAAKQDVIEGAIKVWRVKKAVEAQKIQERANAAQAKLQAQADKAGITMPIPQIITPPVEKVKRVDGGQVQERKTLVIEVKNLKELCTAIAGGTIPIDCILPNMPKIRALVTGGMMVPGVESRYETNLTVRAA